MEFSFLQSKSHSLIKRFPVVTIEGFLHGKGQLLLDKMVENPLRRQT